MFNKRMTAKEFVWFNMMWYKMNYKDALAKYKIESRTSKIKNIFNK